MQTVPSGAHSKNAGGRVKGKQVKILYDLVTVSGERFATSMGQSLGNTGKTAARKDP